MINELNPPISIVIANNEYGSKLEKRAKMFYLSIPVKIDNLSMLESRLNSFRSLQPNWDGYGAASIEGLAVANSLKFLEVLPEHLIENIQADDITPTPYGTIVLEWRNEKGELISAEVGNNTFGFFTEFHDNDSPKIDSVDFNENSLPRELYLAFTKLFKD